MKNDIVLFDPEQTTLQPRIMQEGNHLAAIVAIEVLPLRDDNQVYRQFRLQWKGVAGEVRQDLIYEHWGDAEKSASALRITSEVIGSIAQATGHVDDAGRPKVVSMNNMMKQIGNKPVAIAVRKQGKYSKVAQIAARLEELPALVPTAAVEEAEVETPEMLNETLKAILGR